MFNNGRFLFCLGLLLVAVSAQQWWETGIGMKLKTADFDKYVGKDKYVAIEFYATFCHYCKLMNSEWDKLAEHYMGPDAKRDDVIIAKMDGQAERAIAMRYGVANFPTILFFKKGEAFPIDRYQNQRTFDMFRAWIDQYAPLEANKTEKKEKLPEAVRTLQALPAGNFSEYAAQIFDKLDSLSDTLKTQKSTEITTMLDEINKKLDSKTVENADINWGHSFAFLFLGVFLGIGISHTIVNYQKLNKNPKSMV